MRAVYWVCAGVALVLAACATAPEQIAGRTLSEYRTFSIAPLPTQGPSSDPAAAARLNETARATIAEALAGKGYVESDPGTADFIVKVETEFSPDPIIENSERRLVIIGLHDRSSDEVVWSKERGRSSSRTLEPELLRKSIVQMLSGLPRAPLTR